MILFGEQKHVEDHPNFLNLLHAYMSFLSNNITRFNCSESSKLSKYNMYKAPQRAMYSLLLGTTNYKLTTLSRTTKQTCMF